MYDGRLLGSGAYKRVTVAPNPLRVGAWVARVWARIERGRVAIEHVERERAVYRRLEATPHDHILQPVQIAPRLLLPLAHMTLSELVDEFEFRGEPLPAVLRRAASWQIGRAILHLSSLRIVHGDVAPRNVLVLSCDTAKDQLHVRLADFGLSFRGRASAAKLASWGRAVKGVTAN
jgi:serine/threonine protein kinase